MTVTTGGALTPPELDASGFTLPSGVPSFTFATESGFNYRMVYSEDVATPMSGWLPVVNALNVPPTDRDGWVNGTGSPLTITDPDAAGRPQRFYRLEKSTP